MSTNHRTRARRGAAVLAVVATTLLGALVPVTSAVASPTVDSGTVAGPARSVKPEVVGSTGLPTAQIDGVAWSQVVVGTTVFVGGEFTTARPPGAAAGTQTQPRGNLLAYDVRTGALLPWAPAANGAVRGLAVSPDGKTLYVAGAFTAIGGETRYRVAAFDVASGALLPFRPVVNATVLDVTVSSSAVYVGGIFTTVNGVLRQKVAAVHPVGGGTLPFTVAVDDGRVQALEVSPDGSSVVIGGSFTTVGGSSNPGYGLVRVSGTTGATIATPINTEIRNGGASSSIYSLASDGDNFYGTGYHFGAGGNTEGTFAGRWSDGSLSWVEDCHGDSYSTAPLDDAVYTVSHKHYCANSGGFPQTNPWRMRYGTAVSKAAVNDTNVADIYGYGDHDGQPRPDMLDWFPEFNTGSFTGQGQGPWSLAAGAGYLVAGGEFTRVNNVPQQGLVRFAKRTVAPDTDGPRNGGANAGLVVTSPASGTALVRWPANFDRGDEELTYRLYRDDQSTIAQERTVTASFWKLPTLTFVDRGLAPGSSHRYRLRATDAAGNAAWSDWVSVTIAGAGSLGTYARTVLEDGPSSYWRMDDASGTTVTDLVGTRNLTARAGVGAGAATALTGQEGSARTLSGTSTSWAAASTAEPAPIEFSVEAWFRSSSTRGGRIVGFGSSSTGSSGTNDRHVYVDSQGRVAFGVATYGRSTVVSPSSYNDGQWHHVAATMDQAGGLSLYVDGRLVGARDDIRTADAYNGVWRVGGDSIGSWPSAPSSASLTGDVDEVALYDGRVLTPTQVREHYEAAGRAVTAPAAPADAYGAAVYGDQPALFWRLAETSGTSVADASRSGQPGTLSGTVTYGVPGALSGVANTAFRLASPARIVGSRQVSNPTRFTTEAWIRTTSTQGGRIVGFGNSASTTSTNYDRHTYMQDDGRIVFGVYRGAEYRATSTAAYNDGTWHHVVSSLGADGMRLYVDGELVGTNPQTRAESYTGWWRVGGDNTWGSSAQTLAGDIDEVAIYAQQLSDATVASHYALGSGVVPNESPTAAFSADVTELAVALDASGSDDPDGTIASYAWSYGDGSTGTGKTSSHTYAADGTYTVTLTVTDDRGATDTATRQVEVAAPPANVEPTASFTTTTSGLDVTVDASASDDPDGTIASYAWTFGDGQGATGRNPAAHTYAAAGSYTVTLTVTDDDGATGVMTKEVTVAEPSGAAVEDGFGRAVSNGWGTAPTGGDWAVGAPASAFSVASGTGRMALPAGATRVARLSSVSAQDVEVQATVSLDRLPAGTGFISLASRTTGTTGYVGRLRVGTDGSIQLHVGRGVASITALAGGVVSGLTFEPGTRYRVRLQTTGTSPTTVRAKVWVDGTAEPADWRATVTDSTAELQQAGGIGVQVYVGGATGAPVVTAAWDDLWAGEPGTAPGGGTPPANVAPTAAFTSSSAGLVAELDGRGSDDSDGTIASYTWDLGDGSTATGATPSHTYGASGTYTVRLTVTDDDGATDSVTHDVTVTAPAAGTLAEDAFARTVANGWGSAVTGGAWTASNPQSSYSVGGGEGRMALTPGATRVARLGALSARDVDAEVVVGADVRAAGTGFWTLAARTSGTTGYVARLRVGTDDSLQLHVGRGVATIAPLAGGVVPGLTFDPAVRYRIRLQVTGASPTTVRAKVWVNGTAEPGAWFASTTDSTADLQSAGGIGLQAYVGGAAGSPTVTVGWDDLVVEEVP
ncbi:PKD domain-containing protein [Flavimobilis sp. GY10621]|uniref:PKD domain-containing protein n=1 Tax=Flavimobilis rhizosphaerae TaxID=2775421 RepID=A0ABR9DMB4_9MICO|nr:PKD domain-containing protein [Flavimobilis rhizosphaerae]MBD9698243.1 PKD domain-containing protein [Flavimobilis rhizosphaerae]